jgi:DNA-directed RNA polymerase specialized sigma24 family protein
MAEEGSVSRWLGPLQEGDPAAAQQLWQRYFLSLVELARQRLRQQPRRAADEEDVALSAFDSFCRNAGQGRFPDLHDRGDLWRLLAIITLRKVSHLVRDEARQKRGGLAQVSAATDEDQAFLLEGALSREPSPELAAQMTEECERLLRRLEDHELRQVALWRMEGHTIEDIALRLGCAPRSVKRKLQLIRNCWEDEDLS